MKIYKNTYTKYTTIFERLMNLLKFITQFNKKPITK